MMKKMMLLMLRKRTLPKREKSQSSRSSQPKEWSAYCVIWMSNPSFHAIVFVFKGLLYQWWWSTTTTLNACVSPIASLLITIQAPLLPFSFVSLALLSTMGVPVACINSTAPEMCLVYIDMDGVGWSQWMGKLSLSLKWKWQDVGKV